MTEALARAAERIGEIVSAAERALEVLDFESKEGPGSAPRSSNRDRLVHELIQTLVERTELLRSEAEGLAWSLERASRQIAGHQTPTLATAPSSPNGPGQSRPSEGVRLLATQMAVAGSTPEEIADRLRKDFGIQNAPELVAQVLQQQGSGRHAAEE